MATQLFLGRTVNGGNWNTGNNDADPFLGTTSGWFNMPLRLTRDAGVNASSNVLTVAGATNGVVVPITTYWISDPLDADVTISGSITWNIWASESNMSANVAINGRLEKIDGATNAVTLIDQTTNVTEVAVTTRAANNFSETPAAGVACKRGDRLRVFIFGDDAGTMASGFNFNMSYGGTTAAADGDSYVTLTENLTFVSEPAGSQVFLTDTASPVATASVDREAWTSRGAGVQTDVRNTAAGFTAPLQVTDTAGGTVVDWFTKGLTAFTLGGAVRCNVRGLESNLAANASFQVQIAVVDNDGTNPVVWGIGKASAELATTESAQSFLVAGDDLSVTNDQRIRIRISIDDFADGSVSSTMAAGQTVTLHYAGTSGGASGDTYFTFTQSLTEYVPPVRVPYFKPYTQLLAH